VREFNDRYDIVQVNQTAYEFATTTDMQRREELQLKLLECWHGYLCKYLNMIIFGQLPALYLPTGKDAKAFLSLLIGPSNPSQAELRNECKTLHLAFKEQQTTDDVYDILVLLFLKVCAHYDPLIPKRTERVCQFIEAQDNPILRSEDISAAMGFDASGSIRVLRNGGYISSIYGPKKIVLGYQRGPNWPPTDKFFLHGKDSTGFAFVPFAQRFFRWYLGDYISEKRGNIENRKDVVQFEHRSKLSRNPDDCGRKYVHLDDTPHRDGAFTDAYGVSWASDIKLLDHWRTFGLSNMDDKWVTSTNDFLFRSMTAEERYLLQLVFVKECSWTEISRIFQCDSTTARSRFNQIMIYLEGRSKARSTVGKRVYIEPDAPHSRRVTERCLVYA